MNTNFREGRKSHLGMISACALAGIGLILSSATASAQGSEQITVSSPRVTHQQIARSDGSGAPIEMVTFSAQVQYADLDLSRGEDRATLESRVRSAAKTACRRIEEETMQPDADGSCVKDAVHDAMANVRTPTTVADAASGSVLR